MAGDALRAIGGALFGAVTGRQSYFDHAVATQAHQLDLADRASNPESEA